MNRQGAGRSDWHETNGLAGYHQRVYPNRKVGHVIRDGQHLALYDGIYLGATDTLHQAQQLVDNKAAS